MSQIDQYQRLWLQHWHGLCDPEGPPWRDGYSAAGMFNDLWNDRERLAACLAPLPKAAVLAQRINEIIDAAVGGSSEPPGLYLVITHAHPATDRQLTEWVVSFYQRCRELTGAPRTEIVVDLLHCDDPQVAASSCDKDRSDELHDALFDWLGDYVAEHCIVEEQAAYDLLDEPLYKMACDYMLSEYVRWAFVNDKVKGSNPFRAQFDLWRSAAYERLLPDGRVKVFAPARASGGSGA